MGITEENQEELKLWNRWRTDGFSNMSEKNGIVMSRMHSIFSPPEVKIFVKN